MHPMPRSKDDEFSAVTIPIVSEYIWYSILNSMVLASITTLVLLSAHRLKRQRGP
ncbi:hypothetical protein PpBr36_07889 [Pyricularia pennisetigena]|uniref:hypothetical protein n=1 Tax=Pyricularia pennisetigena TaxID=1578925 RepID=UPI001151E4C7|nr:hypothetical protein PpBr36_07889 [Pyricularia pennisetigena]TLS25880.1 hypothetical protein PpBr36_07889 [Pyricularia pennisetigena]